MWHYSLCHRFQNFLKYGKESVESVNPSEGITALISGFSTPIIHIYVPIETKVNNTISALRVKLDSHALSSSTLAFRFSISEIRVSRLITLFGIHRYYK